MADIDQQPIDWSALRAERHRAAQTILFVDDEPGYTAWIRRHPSGFVVSVSGRDAMLHTAQCSHIQPDDQLRNTANTKICSSHEDLLAEKARADFGGVARCQSCG